MTENELAAPSLPKAINGVLDLGNGQDNVVSVIIGQYAEIDKGDKITVRFDDVSGKSSFLRYAYVADLDSFPPLGQEVQIRPLSVLSDGQFTVFYTVESRAANVSTSKPLGITIKNAPGAEADVQYHQSSYDGFYLQGMLDSWIVPFDYTITKNSDVLMSPFGVPAAQDKVTLTLCQRNQATGPSNAVGGMSYDAGKWTFALSGSGVVLKKGDELSWTLAGNANLSVAVAV